MAAVIWLHLVAAAVWLGGLITIGALIPVLRKAGATREEIQAAARRFGTVSWTAMVVAVVTGLIRLWPLRADITGSFQQRLVIKLVLVGAAIALAGYHQGVARHQTPLARAVVQTLLLVLGLAIFGAAVAL